jgi:hypothetical protein
VAGQPIWATDLGNRYRRCMEPRDEDRDDNGDGDPTGSYEYAYAMQGIPDDARMLGLDRNSQEGALVSMAGSLSGAKLSHRIVAWALLVVFIVPGLLGLVHNIF